MPNVIITDILNIERRKEVQLYYDGLSEICASLYIAVGTYQISFEVVNNLRKLLLYLLPLPKNCYTIRNDAVYVKLGKLVVCRIDINVCEFTAEEVRNRLNNAGFSSSNLDLIKF